MCYTYIVRTRNNIPNVKQRKPSKYDQLVGQTFGTRKVLESLPRSLFQVKCLKCGHLSVQRGIDLQKMNNRSCINCIINARDANVTFIYNRVKGNAKTRKIKWDLDINQFQKIAQNRCFYCNCIPSKSPGFRDRSPFYHGLDRLNNNLGYTVDNSVSCCSICNYAKHTLSIEEFKTWLTNCYTHTILNEGQDGKTISK